jgi:hypothetical protein
VRKVGADPKSNNGKAKVGWLWGFWVGGWWYWWWWFWGWDHKS